MGLVYFLVILVIVIIIIVYEKIKSVFFLLVYYYYHTPRSEFFPRYPILMSYHFFNWGFSNQVIFMSGFFHSETYLLFSRSKKRGGSSFQFLSL